MILADASTTPSVLLVEDNLDDVLLARLAFRKAGLESALLVAADGEQAVAMLQGDALPPRFILLDWKLPKMDGAQVLQWIRARPSLTTLPVAVLSSSGEVEDRQEAMAAGADMFLQKPFAPSTIAQLAERLSMPWLLAGSERPQA